MSFQRILVALDESELSKAVFERAIVLAQKLPARLKLFSCISADLMGQSVNSSDDLSLLPGAVMSPSYPMAQVDVVGQQTDRVQAVLQPYSDAAQQLGLAIETEIKVGSAGELICEIAQEWNADLIILGRRGRSGLQEALLGSVSNYVFHHAPCAVLVIQSEAIDS